MSIETAVVGLPAPLARHARIAHAKFQSALEARSLAEEAVKRGEAGAQLCLEQARAAGNAALAEFDAITAEHRRNPS